MMHNIYEEYKKAETNTTQKDFKFGVLYFGWSNQPSSSTMKVYIGKGVLYAVILVFCEIPETRKAN